MTEAWLRLSQLPLVGGLHEEHTDQGTCLQTHDDGSRTCLRTVTHRVVLDPLRDSG